MSSYELGDDEPPPLEVVADSIDWDLPDLEPVLETIPDKHKETSVEKKEPVKRIPSLEPVPGTIPAKETPVKETLAKVSSEKKVPAEEKSVEATETKATPKPKVTKPEAKETKSKEVPKAITPKSLEKVSIPSVLDSPSKSETNPRKLFKRGRSAMKAEEMKNLGNDAIRDGDYDKAIELYSKAIALDKVNLDREGADGYRLYCNRAKAYLAKQPAERRYFKWALKDAEMAIKIKPDFAKAHYRAAVALEGLGEKDKAMNKYLEIAKMVPGDVSIAKRLINLAQLKPDVVYVITLLLDPTYSHITSFLDLTSAYLSKLLSPKPEEYAKISKDDQEVKDDGKSFEEQVKTRQKLFFDNDGEKVAVLLSSIDNRRLKVFGKKFQKICNSHKS